MTQSNPLPADPGPALPPSRSAMLRAFARIGILSFGGPAAQIAVMHRELVETRRWIGERQFLGALSLTMLLPGPEAMQLATWAGWRMGGTWMGLAAGLLFVGPGAVVIAALAYAYAAWGEVPLVAAAFLGIKALVVVVVVLALRRLAGKALSRTAHRALAIAAFAAMAIFGVPFPLVIATAALAGAWLGAPAPRWDEPHPPPVAAWTTARTVILWLILWALPIIPLWLTGHTFLTDLALFFAKLAVVTFGGAYAVLAYMAQAVVETHGWLTAPQMIDALGLAETTPGPLILVTEFTAILAGLGQGGPMLGAVAGALCLWMTFVPCFLWIFALAPHLDRLLAAPRLAGALAAITAAVTGVIANLALWFTLHVVFARVDTDRTPPRPDWSSLDPAALPLIALAAILLVPVNMTLMRALPLMAAAGVLVHSVTG